MDRLQVIAVSTRTGVSKAGSRNAGNAWEMTIAQCILHKADGNQFVGELVIPKGHGEVKPGDYSPTFKLAAFGGKIEAVIDTIAPLKAGSFAAAKAA